MKKNTGSNEGDKGRPQYEPSPEHLETAYNGALKGLSEEKIAESIGISYSTFRRNKEHFRPVIKKARGESNDPNCDKVEDALLKEAVGYTFIEEQEEKSVGIDGKAMVKKKTITKWIRPSVIAQFFYLVNRRPELWQSINKVDYASSTDNFSEQFKEIAKIMRERDLDNNGKQSDVAGVAEKPDTDSEAISG